MKPTLVYSMDPLCGWCFAFADTALALRAEFQDQVQWEVACGGLVVGERVVPIAAEDAVRAVHRALQGAAA